jgi:spore coat protein U-like protein
MTVNASVQGSCLINQVPSLNFPAYDPTLSNGVQAQVLLTYTCANGLSNPTISLSGVNGAGDGSGYKLMWGGNTLMYSLHSESYTGTTWGNSGSNLVTGTANGTQQSVTIYGVIPAGQSAPNGSYTDTITISFSY